jgi:hypothetical protein
MKKSAMTPISQNIKKSNRLPEVNRPIAANSKRSMRALDTFSCSCSGFPENRVTNATTDAISTNANDTGVSWKLKLALNWAM